MLNFSVCPSVRLSVRPSVPPLEGSIASRLRPHLSPHNDDSCIFESPSNLDVHPRIRFSILEKKIVGIGVQKCIVQGFIWKS